MTVTQPESSFERAFVWGGAVAFALSLAVTALTWAVIFGRTAPFHGWWPLAVDVALFGAFAAHHSVFARDSVKAALESLVPTRLLRSVYVWTASLLLLVVCATWRPIGGEAYRLTGAAWTLTTLVQLTGAWLGGRSLVAIDFLELAGTRGPEACPTLQRRGPYRLVRHPMHLGLVLLVLGAPHMTGDRLAFAVTTVLYLIIAVRWEERGLERTFGDAYARYRRDVPWRMLPYVY